MNQKRVGANYPRCVHIFLEDDCIVEVFFQGKLFEVNNRKQSKQISFHVDDAEIPAVKRLYGLKKRIKVVKKRKNLGHRMLNDNLCLCGFKGFNRRSVASHIGNYTRRK